MLDYRDGKVFMKGEARYSFEGKIDLSLCGKNR